MGKSKNLWISPPIERLMKQIDPDELGQKAGRRGEFSSRIAEIVERYEFIMQQTGIPAVTEFEREIIDSVTAGRKLDSIQLKYFAELVLESKLGNEEDRKQLSEKTLKWTIAEKITLIESFRWKWKP